MEANRTPDSIKPWKANEADGWDVGRHINEKNLFSFDHFSSRDILLVDLYSMKTVLKKEGNYSVV